MKKIAIIPNSTKDLHYSVSCRVAELLSKCGATVYIEKKYGTDLFSYASTVTIFPSDIELIVVIGGDGSLIDASVIAVEYDVPVLGVNLGNLGYLAEVEVGELEILKRLYTQEYKIEEKMLLCASVMSKDRTVTSTRLAVNDVILSHETYVGLAELSLTNSDGASLKYRADGLILSTPIGSTAYSLSAGGPIVSHDIDCILATPICPHSFFNRSIIFNPTEEICLANIGHDVLNVTVDGRHFSKLQPQEKCVVRTSNKKFKMLTFNKNNMFSTLFSKMKRFENI